MSQYFEFSANLPEAKTRRIYQGHAKYLLVYTDDGLKLQLPAVNFRPYVSDQGIQGRFGVTVDSHNRIIQLVKLG